MGGARYFQNRIRLLGIVATILASLGFGGGLLIKAEYDKLVEEIRERGLRELQHHQNLQRSLAQVHMRVTEFMGAGLAPGDEQRVYAESKAVANLLDDLLAADERAHAQGGHDSPHEVAAFRQTIAQYRSDVLLAMEMLTVNPALSERYLVRSASSLSRMNLSLVGSFESGRSAIERSMQSTLETTERNVTLLVAALIFAAGAILATFGALTRRLSTNFRIVDGALARLASGTPDIAPPVDQGEGEFRTIATGLRRFRDVLTERDLAQSQMRAIFDSILEGVIVIDERGRIIETNPAAGRLFGYPTEELVGQNVKILTPSAIAAAHDGHLERFRKTGEERIIGKARAMEGRRRDGSQFPIQLAVSHVEVSGTTYFVGVIADITLQIDNERLLREARDAALSSSRLKAEFLATMSHEIRTPMNGILGMAQLLDGNSMTDDERRNCTRILLNSSRTLITLLNDILDLSKVEAGRLVLNEETTSPASLLDETAALFREAAQSKGLTLSVSATASSRSPCLLDPVRVRQMLSNLVGNAVKFTDHGGVLIELAVETTEPAGKQLVFRVVDTGPGIEPADLDRLFGKYSQLDTSSTRRHGGTGLGLSIVRQFASAMQGDAGVESVPGKGSTFWFRIPVRRAAGDTPDVERDVQAAGETPASFNGRVLIAEDVDANRIFLQFALRGLGLDVRTVGDGRDAVDAAANDGPFDCIFMDMRMPELDGEDATKLIRQHEAAHLQPRCPIVAVTANAYDEDRRRCLDAGMDDFLAKPVKIADLRQVLGRHLPAERRSASTARPHTTRS